jgi:cytidyltransferase-like protein
MKKVITYGTFDLFHFGHLEILRRAKNLGDDWKENFDELKDICKVVYIKHTKGISASNLRENTINRFLII